MSIDDDKEQGIQPEHLIAEETLCPEISHTLVHEGANITNITNNLWNAALVSIREPYM